VYVYCVLCTSFPPVAEICARRRAISVSTFQQSRVGQIGWFGSLSAISQLASRGGEMGSWATLCLHSVTQPYLHYLPQVARAGRGVAFPPLGYYTYITHPYQNTEFQSHGRRINKKGKDELYFHFGLAVLSWFEARVRECYAAHLSLAVAKFWGDEGAYRAYSKLYSTYHDA
jgi:hypothetical protein